MYRLLRSFLFLLPPETAHYFSMNILKVLCSGNIIRKAIAKSFKPKSAGNMHSEIWNLQFKNRVGLAAGFDKNAKYLRELEILGFGFVEIGTVTPKPQSGNEKPRLFRLPKDKALINRMGFNNDGVEVIGERLRKWREIRSMNYEAEHKTSNFKPQTLNLIIGGNIGKNKYTPNEDAWKDYAICFNALHPYVDFFVVNVSSPNTPGLRELHEKTSLQKLLIHLQNENAKYPTQRPILLKIAPDLTFPQIDDVIDLAKQIKLDGIVATNTTVSRELLATSYKQIQKFGLGGLSGKPLQQKSTDLIKYIHIKTNGTIPIIASGGIFNSADANEKFSAGASLIEVWTGLIYEGPSIVKRICNGLI
ncbi:MAG: quinone-dependent dihydroorotate dehydrogenase [Chitinophagaceae bacterium]